MAISIHQHEVDKDYQWGKMKRAMAHGYRSSKKDHYGRLLSLWMTKRKESHITQNQHPLEYKIYSFDLQTLLFLFVFLYIIVMLNALC